MSIRKNRLIRVERTKILEKDKNIIIIKVVKKIIYWLMKWHGITLDKIKWRKKYMPTLKNLELEFCCCRCCFDKKSFGTHHELELISS